MGFLAGRVSAFVSEEPSLGEPVAKEVEHHWMGFHTISLWTLLSFRSL